MFGGVTDFIVDKLKPYLSQVFRNFDADNFGFSVGWSGATLELKDLQFRPTLLQDLGIDLPFQVDILGGIGKIYVEIGLSLTVTVTDVCLLVSSLRRLTWDEQRELKAAVDRKRSELETLIKKAVEAAAAADGVQKKKEDDEPGFAMKTIMGYATGCTINLENIHLRFEESGVEEGSGKTTGPPQQIGLMLKKIAVATVDEIEEWSHGLSDSSSTFYKKGDLEQLSVYWNSRTGEAYSADYNSSADETAKGGVISGIVAKLKDYVDNPANVNYVLSPITAAARAMVTRHPQKLEEPFSLPKVHADLKMGVMDLTLTDGEYDAALAMLDHVDQAQRGRKYMKYRPSTHIVLGKKGSTKAWWKMAYDVAVEDIVRKRSNWSWAHIKAHRILRDKYKEAYSRKLMEETPSEEIIKEVQDLEDQLDNFNVLLARTEAEEKMQIRKDLLKKKKDAEAAKSSGWGWGGWGSTAAEVTVSQDEVDKYIADLPEADRKKFLQQIDYDPAADGATAGPIDYPKDYKEFVVSGSWKGIKAKLVKHKDEPQPLEILQASLLDFELGVDTHPAVGGLKASVTLHTIGITGLRDGGDDVPEIFKSTATDKSNFIELVFESHPVSSTADQRIKYESQPSQLTYDGRTFQKLLDFVTPPPSKIQKVGGKSKMVDFSQVSGSKLASMGKTSSTLELDIKIVAPTIVIPEGGAFKIGNGRDALLANLGTLTIKSAPRDKSEAALAKAQDAKAGDMSPEVMAVMFNHFEIQLANFEVLLAVDGDDLARLLAHDASYTQRPTPILLAPLIKVDIYQCIVSEDVRFPKIKVGLSMPAINLDVIDRRFLRLVHLGLTLPLPKPKPAPPGAAGAAPLVVDVAEDPSATYSDALQVISSMAAEGEPTDPEKAPQFTDLVVDVKLNVIKLNVTIQDPKSGALTPFMTYNVNTLAVGLQMKTFGMSLDASIASMNAEYIGATVPGISGPVYLLNTPTEAKEAFLSVHVFSVTSACPKSVVNPIKQKVEFGLRSVDLILHQDSIKSFVGILFGLKNELDRITPKVPAVPEPIVIEVAGGEDDSSAGGGGQLNTFRKMASKFQNNVDDILLKATATLSRISVKLTSSTAQITQLSILDLIVGFEDKALVSKLSLDLNNLEILNLEEGTNFPKILTVEGADKLIDGDVFIYKPPSKKTPAPPRNADEPQYEIKVKIGGPKLIVLGSYLASVKKFVSNFQDAVSAAAESAASAASAAGDAAAAIGSNLYTTDIKFAIDFKLVSPVVVIAKSDRSLEVLYYCFGDVVIKNQLKQEKDDTAAAPVVLDDLHLSISGVKITRAILDPNTKLPIAESAILQPLEVNLTLVRNLSRSWYKKVAMFKVGATLPSAVISFSDDDIIFIVSCVFDVIEHVSPPGPEKKEDIEVEPAPLFAPVSSMRMGRVGEEVFIGGAVGGSIGGSIGGALEPPVEENPEIADFALVIQKMGVSMYKGANPLAGKAGVQERDAGQAMGGIFLENLSASGHYWTNKTLDAKLGLDGIVTEDSRPSAPAGLRQLIVAGGGGADTGQLLGLGFRMEKGPGDPTTAPQIMSVNLRTQSMKFIFNMGFINELARYGVAIADRLPKLGGDKKEHPADAEHAHDDEPTTAMTGPVSGLSIGAPAAAAAPPSPAPLINADVNMGEITLLVLENPNATETNALLMTISGLVNVAAKSGASAGTASVKMSAYTSKFDLNAPIKKVAEILHPASIDVELELKPGSKTAVDVTTSDVLVHFSAGTLHLVSKIANEFSNSLKSSQKEGEVFEDHSDAWKNKPLNEANFWFVKPAPGGPGFGPLGALALGDSVPEKPIEKVTLNTGQIFFTLESGVGAMTTPLLFIDTSIDASVTDWSSALHVEGALKLMLGYSNPYVGASEYLIEPTGRNAEGKPTPWELKLDVQKSQQSDTDPGKMNITVTSQSPLELMVSKSAIEILQAVAAAFSTAAGPMAAKDAKMVGESELQSAPIVLKNACGSDLTVNVDNTAFLYYVDGERAPPGNISVAQGQEVHFGLLLTDSSGQTLKHDMILDIPEYRIRTPVLVSQAKTRYFQTNRTTSAGAPVGILVDIEITQDYSTHVTVRTLAQVINELEVPVEIYGAYAPGKVFPAGVVEPGGVVSLPFNAVYERTIGVQFKPRGFSWANIYNWPPLLLGSPGLDQHEATTQEGGKWLSVFDIIGKSKPALNGNTNQELPNKNVVIRLRPPFTVRNLLPIPMTIVTMEKNQFAIAAGKDQRMTCVKATTSIGHSGGLFGGPATPAHKTHTFTAAIQHQGQTWCGALALTDDPAAPSSGNCIMTSTTPSKQYPYKPLQLYLKYEQIMDAVNGMTFIVNASYMVLNYTTLNIAYYNPAGKFAATHLATDEAPQMFLCDTPPPPPAAPGAQPGQEGPRTKMCVQVGQGGWSHGVAVDTVGIPTGAICPNPGGPPYELSISIDLASDRVTKIITIAPRYTITNLCRFPMQWLEGSARGSSPFTIAATRTIPFWPPKNAEELLPCLAVGGTDDWTAPIPMEGASSVVGSKQYFLPLGPGSTYGGIGVNVNVQEAKTAIHLNEFNAAEISLLFVNTLPGISFELWEDVSWGEPTILTLEPRSRLFHAWKNPLMDASTRRMNWRVAAGGAPDFQADMSQEETIKMDFMTPDGRPCHCYIFTQGLRRVLMFSEASSNFLDLEKQKNVKEKAATMQIGLSLPNIGISLLNNIQGQDVLYGRITGLGLGYVAYPLGFSASVNVGDIRLDNQDSTASYPIILARKQASPPSAYGRSAPAGAAGGPFLVLHASQVRATPKSNVQFLNGSVDLKEMSIGADMQLVGNILQVVTPGVDTRVGVKAVAVDYSTPVQSVEEFYEGLAGAGSGEDAKEVARAPMLVLRDVKIGKATFTLSFTMAGIDSLREQLGSNPFVNMILNAIGTMRVGITDANFGLEGQHFKGMRTTMPQLVDTLTAHYKSEVTRGAMANIFNLDIPGSPFQLVKGLGKGVGGLLTDPLGGGVGSLVGHTLGGVTEVAGGLFGVLGHVPIAGGLFGGLGDAMTNTSKSLNKSADGGAGGAGGVDEKRMRAPRLFSQGTAIVPYLVEHPDAAPKPAPGPAGGGTPAGGVGTGIGLGPPPPIDGAPLNTALQRTPEYAGAGAFIAELQYPHVGVVLTSNKIFYINLTGAGQMFRISPIDWNTVGGLSTDGYNLVLLEMKAGVDRYGRTVRPHKISINCGSSNGRHELLSKLYEVQMSRGG